MKPFQQRQGLRKLIYSKFTILVVAILILLLARGTWGFFGKYRNTNGSLEALRAEKETLIQKEATLAARVAALQTPRGVEEAIREKFKVAKEGEGVVVVVDEGEGRGDTSTPDSWFGRFIERLNNIF